MTWQLLRPIFRSTVPMKSPGVSLNVRVTMLFSIFSSYSRLKRGIRFVEDLETSGTGFEPVRSLDHQLSRLTPYQAWLPRQGFYFVSRILTPIYFSIIHHKDCWRPSGVPEEVFTRNLSEGRPGLFFSTDKRRFGWREPVQLTFLFKNLSNFFIWLVELAGWVCRNQKKVYLAGGKYLYTYVMSAKEGLSN